MAEIWATAADWARQALTGLPTTERGIRKLADREHWQSRSREGRGGGSEYPLSALPDAARTEMARRDATRAIAETREQQKRQIATIDATNLTARQRQVMEARAALLLEIDRRVIVQGLTATAAVRALATDSVTGNLSMDLAAAAAVANDRSGGDAVLAERTLFRWRTAKADGGLAALAPQITKTAQDLPKWFGEFLPYYARPQKPTLTRALANWGRTEPGRELPSYQQVRRALDKLGSIDRLRGREGVQALKARQAYTARDTSDLLPTSVYLADGKTFDAEIAHPIHGQPFRPELTTIIDAHTRRIVGWSAALDESASAVTDAMRVACTMSGIPAIFYTDRGPGYVNWAMDAPLTGLLGRLGTTPMRALPYNSQGKGIVERVNHEWSHLARDLPTYISRDMDREAKKAAYHRTRRELALTGTSRLLPTWEDFLRASVEAIGTYNDRPHSGLPKTIDPETGRRRHLTPNEAWNGAFERGLEVLLVSAAEAEDLFRPWVERKTRRALVEWLGNAYFAIELEEYDGEDVIVAYDIQDASRVWVRAIDIDAEGNRQPGRLIATAAFEGHKTRYVPVSAEQAAMETRGRARERRLQKKIEVVRQELHPATLLEGRSGKAIEHQPTHPLSLDMPEPVHVPTPMLVGERPTFSNDLQYARWLIEHSGAVTSQDLSYVREYLLGSQSSREELRIAGVDIDALRAIAREAA